MVYYYVDLYILNQGMSVIFVISIIPLEGLEMVPECQTMFWVKAQPYPILRPWRLWHSCPEAVPNLASPASEIWPLFRMRKKSGRRRFNNGSHSEGSWMRSFSRVLWMCISIRLYHHSRHSRSKQYRNTTPKPWQRSVLDPRNHQSDVSQLQFHQGLWYIQSINYHNNLYL
jgi:hypothetical protein